MNDRKSDRSILEIVLVDYRWIFVCFFLLPLSFLYNLFWFARNFVSICLNSGAQNHEKKLKNIQMQVSYVNFLAQCTTS